MANPRTGERARFCWKERTGNLRKRTRPRSASRVGLSKSGSFIALAVTVVFGMIGGTGNAWAQLPATGPIATSPGSIRSSHDFSGGAIAQTVQLRPPQSARAETMQPDRRDSGAHPPFTLAGNTASEDSPLLRAGGFPRSLQPNIHPMARGDAPQERVQWRSLLRDSGMLLGVMHGFRIATEPSTRDTLKNNPVTGYFDSVGSMHGWSDGDGLFENYLGHPIQGAIAGYVWTHNDSRYHHVEFGRNRDYWMSRLRAYAYSWAFSEQFEIGPLSEASVGQIQSSCCAYGFVDHVITPNGGLGWMIAGDALDRFVVRKIEDRTKNRAYRIIARGALNPPLAFANLMAFRVPWHRDNRPGVTSYDGELYLRPAEPSIGRFAQPLIPKFELSATLPSFMIFGGLTCVGGGGVGAFRLSPAWQWTIAVSGCTLGNSLPSNWSGDSLTFSSGPQWTWRSNSRFTPRLGFRIGGQKVTEEYVDPVLKEHVLGSLPPDANPADYYYDYVTPYESTGLMIAVSGGVDLRLNSALAIRLGSVDYVHSWLANLTGRDFNNAVRVSSGLVLSVGTW
jgi:hypothetical protein